MGEIRNVYYPQNEMNTVLLPVATGCPYNRCAFCSMYKDEIYQEVPIQEIEQELMNGDPYTERIFLRMCGSVCICEKSQEVLCGRA